MFSKFTINVKEISCVDKLRSYWEKVRSQKYSELWLEHPAMPTLAAMVNDDRAWLTFFRAIEDPGFHSCNPDYTGPADAVLDYIVANGQGDEYPVSWTYPTETALQAAEHFYLYGERAPFITWCADFDEETT